VRRPDARLGWALVLPALAVVLAVAVAPIAWTVWESFHRHDLRMPWLGRPFVGWANYVELAHSPRMWAALGHTAVFTGVSVSLELVLGLALALALSRIQRARGVVRTAVLLPWAVPTVVAALVWRFLFESPFGLVNALLVRIGAAASPPEWFVHPLAAWVPIVLADVWKMTPFVAVLLLAGLQQIDPAVDEAAQMDGAGPWRRLFSVTLPLLAPALLVAFVFRAMDAFRVFDLIYVLTGGGPGTATEPLALLTFTTLLQNLRFGVGAALSVFVFVLAFLFALACIRLMGETVVGAGN
jgi:ABC-type sugar transport system permease subunit